jgi:hypothetical protein
MSAENTDENILDLIYADNLKRVHLEGIKVGGSNQISSKVFLHKEFVLGFLTSGSVYSGVARKNYKLSEVEIICHVKINRNNEGELSWRHIDSYLGIEFPLPRVIYEEGVVIDAVEDNCGAYEILLIQKAPKLGDLKGKLCLVGTDTPINFDTSSLLNTPMQIVNKTIGMLFRIYPNIDEMSIYIATGGISKVFQLQLGQEIEVKYL